jgi:hypothetical protein
MAVTFSKALQPSNSTDAHFRAWIGFIDRTLTNGGWVNTADTGQTAVASFVAPTAINQARGYRIYRMDDTLHATHPVYLRIDFGSAGATNNVAVWITLGPATDGAGAISRPWFNSPTGSVAPIQASGNSTTLALPYSFGSADTNRVGIAFAHDQATSQGFYLFFTIERTFGADGEPNEDGVLLMYSNLQGTNINRYLYLRYDPVPQAAVEQENRRVQTEYSPSAQSDLVGVSVVFPWYLGLPRQPGSNILIGRRGDWDTSARINVELYGAQHVYQALFTTLINSEGNTLPLMRYE